MKKLILLLPCLLIVLTGCGAKKTVDLSKSNDNTPVVNEKVNSSTPEANSQVVNNSVLYQNKRFNFSLSLPLRWQSYKVEETKDNSGYYYAFYLKHNKTLNNGYGKPFVLAVFKSEAWKKIKTEVPKPWVYINENVDYVFAYATAQDDEGYIGFGEIVQGEEYQGPIYDVKTIIIPSFAFTTPELKAKLSTYINKKYNYSFDYPSEETLNVGSDRGQYLVDRADISVVQAQPEDNQLDFEQLMFNRVKLLCDADGVSASITCPRYVSKPLAFRTSFDLPAYKLIFVEQTTKFNDNAKPTISAKNKIIYVVDLGGKGKERLMLAVAPTTDDLTIANNLTLSVRKNK